MTFLCFCVIKENGNRLIIKKLRFCLFPVNFADSNILTDQIHGLLLKPKRIILINKFGEEEYRLKI